MDDRTLHKLLIYARDGIWFGQEILLQDAVRQLLGAYEGTKARVAKLEAEVEGRMHRENAIADNPFECPDCGASMACCICADIHCDICDCEPCICHEMDDS